MSLMAIVLLHSILFQLVEPLTDATGRPIPTMQELVLLSRWLSLSEWFWVQFGLDHAVGLLIDKILSRMLSSIEPLLDLCESLNGMICSGWSGLIICMLLRPSL